MALLLAPAAARAGNFTVTNTHNSGPGSLRKAITNANASSGSDTIAINTTGTLTLQSPLPQVNTGVAITGPGKTQFVVSGADAVQPLIIQSGTVSISGLTISHGLCDRSCGSEGGAILNRGHLKLTAVAVASSTASATGGTNAFSEGGGIENKSGASLDLILSTVSGNTVSAHGGTSQNAAAGGGIMNRGTLTVNRSTVGSNSSLVTPGVGGTTNANGGGIDNDGTLTIVRSTVSGNAVSATGGTANSANGGGIGNFNDPSDVNVTIDRSTVSGNTVTSPGTNQAGGMGITGGTTEIIKSSTFAHNSAASGSNILGFTSLHVKNTIISNPIGASNCGAALSSDGYNLADDSSCSLAQGTDQEDTDPMLTSLAFHGGPTKTYGLQVGSPAIDRGRNSTGETVDQRGLKRPSDFGAISNVLGNGTDIGAFEVQDTVPPDTIIDSGPSATTHDPTPKFTFHATEAGSTFQCRVDARVYAACTTPRTTQHLADGTHTFTVRARDAASNLDPSPASRSFTVKTPAVKRSGSTLVITAAPGARDNLEVTKPSASTIRVTDKPVGAYTGSGVHAVSGSGCTISGDSTANCNASGIAKIRIASGDEPDRIVNATSLPSSLAGGPADDVLSGGSVKDTITGGSGADTMKGRNGDDLLRARDLASDTLINCDGGSAPGGADTADLDLLPQDPDSVVLGCETKTRH